MTITEKRQKMDELRVLASKRIHEQFDKASVVVAQYGEHGAYALCVWKDGVKEYMYIDYSDLMPESQHEKAMVYVKSMVS